MKKWMITLFVVLALTSLVFAAGMKEQGAEYITAGTATAIIVQTSADTTQTIVLPLYPNQFAKALFPSSVMIATNYDAQNDTVNVLVNMDLSDDGTNWMSYRTGNEDSLISAADGYRVVHWATTSMPHAKYARFRLTGVVDAGDTVNVTQTFRFFYTDD